MLQDAAMEVDVIKQGAQYRSIYTAEFAFRDCLHYSSPCSYSNYLKQWKVQEEKSIFPYQYYNSIEELETATEFPPREGFYSELTGRNVSEEDYVKSKREFDNRKSLPGNLFKLDTINIYIKKNIPIGAGLGGGSSDAATILMGINKLANINLTKKELMTLGLGLGADVPFFIFGENAWVEGVGEKLSKFNIPNFIYYLCYPNFSISTESIFKSFKFIF